jgi:predicted nucleic acid-binding protein
MPVVLDVSATLSWLIDDERDTLAIAMANAVVTEGAIVPRLWRLELRSALLTAERRGRLTQPEIADLLNDLRDMPIAIAANSAPAGDEEELALARTYGLSLYDAAYLDLAVRLKAFLMTRDELLATAAGDLQLRWHPA